MSLLFSQLAAVYEQLESISSGKKMREILAALFKRVPNEEIDEVVYISAGRIASEFEDVNFGMAEKMVVHAVALAVKKSELSVVSQLKKSGDLGNTIVRLTNGGRGKLTVHRVFTQLQGIAVVFGKGSQDKKIKMLSALLQSVSPLEAKYLVRIVLGTMRLGAGTMTILDALSLAYTESKESKKLLEQAYNICPDLGFIAKTFAAKGIYGLKTINVLVGRPIKMMLASRVSAIKDIEKKMGSRVAVEEKYDGERVQIHYDGKKLTLYSRRLENVTSQFPDIVQLAMTQLKVKSCVLEGEIVPVDKNGKLLPFQTLMQRRRKHRVEEYAQAVPVCLFLFDLLYLDGKSYIHEPYEKRRAALERILSKKENKIVLAHRVISNELSDITVFLRQSLRHGCEGIMAKSIAPHAVYRAGTRGWLWIKWKKEYAKELSDTFDLVAVGAFYGRGKRKGNYGALLCAAYNQKNGTFETFCKLGSGFSNEQLAGLLNKFRECVVSQKPASVIVNRKMEPDVWFKPKIVVEVLGAELTKSPAHTCAAADEQSEQGEQGLALRFPRFIGFREDKSPEHATTSKEIRQMYMQRAKR